MVELKYLYFIAGFLFLTNIGTIVAILKDKNKDAYSKGYRDAEINKNFEKLEHKIDKAHERIDKLKERYESQ